MSHPRRNVLGVPVDPLTLREVLARCEAAIDVRQPLVLGMVNAAKVIEMRRDRRLFDAVAGCDLVLADGMAVVWAGALLGQSLPERVAGIDLFERLLEVADRRGASLYLLGAHQEVLDEVSRRIVERHPRARIAGMRNGYFKPDEEPQIVQDIRESSADMLFVAMSPPKKEFFLARWSAQMGVPVCHGVGGSFDVLAGRTRRAPVWMQRIGMEWFYRVLQEPGRMWRRYFVTNTVFLWLLLGEILRRPFRGSPRPERPTSEIANAVDHRPRAQ